MSFPTRQSHYSRHDNPGRLYLSPDLSIAKMYQLFLARHDPAYVAHLERKREALIGHEEACSSEIKPIASVHYYHDVFVSEFNLNFGYPRSDTCDSLRIRTEASDNEEKAKLEADLQDHLKLADEVYASLRKDCKKCKEPWSQGSDNVQ